MSKNNHSYCLVKGCPLKSTYIYEQLYRCAIELDRVQQWCKSMTRFGGRVAHYLSGILILVYYIAVNAQKTTFNSNHIQQ